MRAPLWPYERPLYDAALLVREGEQRDMRDRFNAHRCMRQYKP
ncbi:hypothetical protein [Paraburkholderia nemoris]|nr:hypothetical protein [Paraburkholderia nemoris]